VKIIIGITDQTQAERFLLWIQNRGDILLGDMYEAKFCIEHPDEIPPQSVYIVDATEMSDDVSKRQSNRTDSGIRGTGGYSKPGPY